MDFQNNFNWHLLDADSAMDNSNWWRTIDFTPEICLGEPDYGLILPIDQDILNLLAFENSGKGNSLFPNKANQSSNDVIFSEKTPETTQMREVDFKESIQDMSNICKDDAESDSELATRMKNKRSTKKKSHLSGTTRKRKDIIFKSLLRRCRKFYQTEFNAFCNYSKVKKRRSENFFFDHVAAFTSEKYQNPTIDDLTFYMAALIKSKDTLKSINYFAKGDEDSLKAKTNKIEQIHQIL
jgi:hypothetical protein